MKPKLLTDMINYVAEKYDQIPISVWNPRCIPLSRIANEIFDQPDTSKMIEDRNFWIYIMQHKMNARENYIFKRRYYYDNTFEEIGKDLGVGTERVRQIHRQCIQKIKDKWEEVDG